MYGGTQSVNSLGNFFISGIITRHNESGTFMTENDLAKEFNKNKM